MSDRLGIIATSCDQYYDTWIPFFFFFEKYWPDCPYPIYLSTNTKLFNRKNVTQIFSNKFTNWSDETLTILKQFPHEYILYFQDDYFLTNKVEANTISQLFNKMVFYNADYLRLFPSPGPDQEFMNDPEIGLISERAEYRTSLQCCFWKKETFIHLLKQDESPWEFERNSPTRSKGYLFLSLKNQNKGALKKHIYPVTYFYMTAIIKGRWHRGIIKILQKHGLKIDTNYRKIASLSEELDSKIYLSLPKFLQHIYDFIKFRFFTSKR